jgi:hypothetical protein
METFIFLLATVAGIMSFGWVAYISHAGCGCGICFAAAGAAGCCVGLFIAKVIHVTVGI